MKFTGTAVIEKDYEVDVPDDTDENEARLAILDIVDVEYPDADLYLIKEIEKIG